MACSRLVMADWACTQAVTGGSSPGGTGAELAVSGLPAILLIAVAMHTASKADSSAPTMSSTSCMHGSPVQISRCSLFLQSIAEHEIKLRTEARNAAEHVQDGQGKCCQRLRCMEQSAAAACVLLSGQQEAAVPCTKHNRR